MARGGRGRGGETGGDRGRVRGEDAMGLSGISIRALHASEGEGSTLQTGAQVQH